MKRLVDNYRHKGLRQKLIVELREKGIKDEAVLSVMAQLPRHYFLDEAFADWAYRDVAFPIASDQTISQPYTVAFQTELLNLNSKDVVLEIGTGSGYQACVLKYLCKRVYSIERQERLFHKTERLLRRIGCDSIRTKLGDGFKGQPRFAPFDKILITCGAAQVPTDLLDQLKEGGVMVIPLGRNTQEMIRITKKNGRFVEEKFGQFSFVPMLHGVASSMPLANVG